MIVGLDLDGTVTACPWFFAALTKGLKANGHKVVVITFRGEGGRAKAVQDLQTCDIAYDVLIMSKNVDLQDIGRWKRRIAIREGIDLMIDDMPEVLCCMPPEVQRLWLCSSQIYDLKELTK